MRSREIDIPFGDSSGHSRIFVTDVVDEDLARLSIDQQPRGQPFPGVLTLAILTEA